MGFNISFFFDQKVVKKFSKKFEKKEKDMKNSSFLTGLFYIYL
jgi:hypothetical protein